MRKTIFSMIVMMLAAAGGGLPVPGTLPMQDAGRQVPQHDTAAIVKLVAVRVLDAEGRPAMGLSKEDFVLLDNGRRMTITEFEVHRLTSERAAEEPEERPAAGLDVRGGLNRKMFIFLDLQGSDVDGMRNAKQAVNHFLDTQLKPDDEVGIIGFSPMRGFFVQVYLTTDREKIRKAVEKTKELRPSSGGMENPFPADASPRSSRAIVVEGGSAGAEGGAMVSGGNVSMGRSAEAASGFSSANSSLFVPGTSVFQRGDFVPRLSDLAEVMKRLPGNKSLVLFTGRDLGQSAKALGRAFADAGTPIYAVNTKNWIMKGFFSFVKEKHIYWEHSLKDLSLASGGEYFADIEDIQTIARDVQALTGNYYVLGYYIQETWDGKFHEIKVEVRNPGLRVIAQEGYYNPKPFAEMSDFEKDLHLFGLIYSDEPGVGEAPEIPLAALNVRTLAAGRDGILLVELAVDPKAGVSPSKVELSVLIRDEDLAPVVSRKWDLDLSIYNGKTVVFCLSVPFETGWYDGRIAVRDVVTGRAAVGRIVFEVESPLEEGIVLSSPVILVPGPDTKIANLPPGRPRRGAPAERTLIDLYPYIPLKHRIVVRNLDFGTDRIQAVVPVGLKVADPENPPRIELTARLVPKGGGDEIPIELEVVEARSAKDGREFLLVDLFLPESARGEYELVITAEDIDTEKSASVTTPLVIK